MKRIAVLDAPSNLGLAMPAPGVLPGCYKLPGAVRDNRLLARIGATDAGCVVPPRYDASGWKRGDGLINAHALVEYTRRLAGRISERLDAGDFLVVLGGDCSILLGPTLALRRRGRYGLVFVDGHSDFRHLGGEVTYVGTAAGEDLALVTGRGQNSVVDIDGLRPYVRDRDVVLLGIRDDDLYIQELIELGMPIRTALAIQTEGPRRVGVQAVQYLRELDGFWVHLDADVLDAAVMPAVDTPSPGGLEHDELVALLAPIVSDPQCVGLELTVFDPDLDSDGKLAVKLTDTLVDALAWRAHAGA
jgi:arginase